MLWVPGQVTWYFDDQPLMSAPLLRFDKQHFFLMLGMQEGANWTLGNMAGVTASSMHLTVDSVRVWQLIPSQQQALRYVPTHALPRCGYSPGKR